jgi:hypothetical protein
MGHGQTVGQCQAVSPSAQPDRIAVRRGVAFLNGGPQGAGAGWKSGSAVAVADAGVLGVFADSYLEEGRGAGARKGAAGRAENTSDREKHLTA